MLPYVFGVVDRVTSKELGSSVCLINVRLLIDRGNTKLFYLLLPFSQGVRTVADLK